MTLFAAGVTRFAAILLTIAFIVSAVPLVTSDAPIVENASAQGGYVKVGWTEDIKNWNPLNVDFVADWVAYNLIYSTLFQYDEDWNQIEYQLAKDYYQVEWPSGNMSTYINITDNAYFRAAAEPEDTSHPLTAEDVKFTLDLIRDNTGNSWDYYLYNVSGAYVVNDYQVQIDTEFPKATLIDDLVWIPILPKFQWEQITGAGVLANMAPEDLIGSGAFYYEDGSKNDWRRFAKAPNYHGELDYGDARDIDYEGIEIQIFADVGGLVLAINNGDVDVVDVTGAQLPAWETIGGTGATVPIIKQITQELGIYDIAINAIPLELRDEIGYADSGNKILLDRTVRQAIGMTLDKQTLRETYFYDMPVEADTVLNPGFWHANLSNPLPFDTAAAKDMLIAAGYVDTDTDDYLEVTEDALAYTEGWADVGDELEFRLHVPDTDPAYSTIGEPWVSWAKEAGIHFDYAQIPSGQMTNEEWYKCEYDLWVWSWYWGPEPLSNLGCWLTDQIRIGGYNCVGPICEGGLNEPDGWWWVDQDAALARCGFDETFDLALKATNKSDRKVLVDQLQEAIYETYTEFPPLCPVGLYAMTTARYDGWGNWTEHVARTVISDMLWIWYDLEPVEANSFPVFDASPVSFYQVEVDVPVTFTIEVSDAEGDEIAVRWDAGDGTNETVYVTGETTEPSVVQWEHTYDTIDTYTLRVGLSDEFHEYWNSETATVVVLAEINQGPSVEGLMVSPLRAYIDDETTWSVWASDLEQGPDGEGLLFTWDWGDGSHTTTLYQPVENETLVQDVQTHTWDTPNTYDVVVWVWDGFNESTNPIHNVSVTYPGGYKVYENMPPTAPMATNVSSVEGVPIACEAVASDPDPDVLRFTWDWGDGTFNVTNHDTSSNLEEEVASTVEHEWTTAGTYPVIIWVDDLTGKDGHNVSTTISAIVLAAGEEAPPGSISIRQAPNPGTVDIPLMLTVGASDPNEDALTVTIDFGDDSDWEVNDTVGGTTKMQYAEFAHTYDDDGIFTVTVYVDDGLHNVSASKDIEVVVNEPPAIALASSYSFFYNQTKVIRPASISDPDGDMLTVWYDWGDDSPMSMGDSEDGFAASHAYNETTDFILTAYADDGKGNNVSVTADVNVQEANLKPTLVSVTRSDPEGEHYATGELIYFNVTVRDTEGDNLTITVDFGDGTTPSTHEFDSNPKENTTIEFTHAFDEEGEYFVNVLVEDNKDHSDATPVSQDYRIVVEDEDTGGISMILLALIAIVIALLIVAALMFMKRKGKEKETTGDMEGMAPADLAAEDSAETPSPPSEEPPPPT